MKTIIACVCVASTLATLLGFFSAHELEVRAGNLKLAILIITAHALMILLCIIEVFLMTSPPNAYGKSCAYWQWDVTLWYRLKTASVL